MHPTDQPGEKTNTAAVVPPDGHSDMFSPSSIAVVGASENPAKIGSQILRNIFSGGYEGEIYPINPHSKKIQGLPVYASVSDIPEAVDHAVIAIPSHLVPAVVEECGKKGVPAVTIISAGFKESGEAGKKLEAQIIASAKRYSMHIIGPNCLGFMNTSCKLNATFSATHAEPGNIVLFSQSGAFGTAILDWANHVNLGFKYFVSLGNKATVDETFLLTQWMNEFEEDNSNIVFAGYLEDIKDGREFMKIASQLSKKHPIIILKPGKSQESVQAMSSHTGAIATDDSIIETALSQAGCVRVDGVQRLFDTIQLLARESIPSGNRVAVVTNAGGPGVATTDIIDDSPLEMAELSESTMYTLQQQLPPAAGTHNPVDVLGDGTAERYKSALETVLIDENVDSVIVLLTPQAVTEVEKTAGVITEIYRKYQYKPVVASFIGGEITEAGVDILNQSQMAIFDYPRQAVYALSNAYRFRKLLDQNPFDQGNSIHTKPTVELPQNTPVITGPIAEEFVQQYGILVPISKTLKPGEDVSVTMSEYPFPVVAKIISPQLLHKTELSAVVTKIKNPAELQSAVRDLNLRWEQQFPQDFNYSIQIQQSIDGGELLILGFKRDPCFGPVILVGAGGILTELFSDTAQRIAPIDQKEALAMLKQTKIYSILEGYRGSTARDIEIITHSITKVSQIAMEHPEITEFDINPFIVLNQGTGGYAVDVKILTNRSAHAQT